MDKRVAAVAEERGGGGMRPEGRDVGCGLRVQDRTAGNMLVSGTSGLGFGVCIRRDAYCSMDSGFVIGSWGLVWGIV
jgi:hypothetical protein